MISANIRWNGTDWIAREGDRVKYLTDNELASYLNDFRNRTEKAHIRLAESRVEFLRNHVWNGKFKWEPSQGRIVEVQNGKPEETLAEKRP